MLSYFVPLYLHPVIKEHIIFYIIHHQKTTIKIRIRETFQQFIEKIRGILDRGEEINIKNIRIRRRTTNKDDSVHKATQNHEHSES